MTIFVGDALRKLTERENNLSSFLIKYHRRTGALKILKFDSLREATLRRLELDKTNNDPNVEIVAVASESEAHLRQSQSRYFSAV